MLHHDVLPLVAPNANRSSKLEHASNQYFGLLDVPNINRLSKLQLRIKQLRYEDSLRVPNVNRSGKLQHSRHTSQWSRMSTIRASFIMSRSSLLRSR